MNASTSRRAFLRNTGAAALSLIGSRMDAQTAKRPNILFVIADDWGHNHSGAYGCTWVNTPSFDRIAREGVRFTNCFTSNPKCSPSRATILTGRNSWQLKEAVNHQSIFPSEFPVYPKLLEQPLARNRAGGRAHRGQLVSLDLERRPDAGRPRHG